MTLDVVIEYDDGDTPPAQLAAQEEALDHLAKLLRMPRARAETLRLGGWLSLETVARICVDVGWAARGERP